MGPRPQTALSDLVVRQWTSEDGLPTNSINDILQSHDGYLWLATYNGLVQFDGSSFLVFDKKTQPNLTTNGFLSLWEDDGPEKTFWAGTQGSGLQTYDSRQFLQSAVGAGAADITVLLKDSRGILWIGTDDQGPLKLDHGSGSSEATALDHPTLSNESVLSMTETADGAVWIGTRSAGLARIEGEDIHLLDRSSGLPALRVNALHYDRRSDHLWIGTSRGLARQTADDRFERLPGTEHLEVHTLASDGHGSLWIGAESGLYRRIPGSDALELLRSERAQDVRRITSLAFDREGSLWLGTSIDGLIQLRQGSFRNITRSNGLTSSRTNAVFELPAGDILIAGDTHRIHRVAEGRVSHEPQTIVPESVGLRDLLVDRDGSLWLATFNGLIKRSRSGDRFYGEADGLLSDRIREVFQDSSSRIWVGTNSGLLRYRPENDSFEPITGFTPSDFILSITEGSDERILVGSRQGFQIIPRQGQSTFYEVGKDLPGSVVFGSLQDRRGDLWVCTNGGLVRIRNGEIHTLTSAAGLPSDSVFDVKEDELGYLWLSSMIGVVRIDKAALNRFLDGEAQSVFANLFNEADGMAGAECAGARRMLKASDGSLWIPTLKGVSIVDPGDLLIVETEPAVAVRRVLRDDAPLAFIPGEPLTIPSGGRRLELEFAVLSYLAPSRIRARYRLDGFDRDWIEVDGSRDVSYTSLPPGDYTFELQAANPKGAWSPRVARLPLTVEPAFYETTWFFVGLAGLLLLTGTLTQRRRVRLERRTNFRLKELLAEQAATQAALKASEERFKILFETASDGILILDRETIVDCNSKACDIYGYSREEMVGRRPETLAAPPASGSRHGRRPHRLAETVREALNTGRQATYTFRQARSDGQIFQSEISLAPFTVGPSRLVEAIVRDVSDQVKFLEELEAKNAELERYTYTVSHDLKGPLFTIRGALELLRGSLDSSVSESLKGDLKLIDDASERMERMLNELLALSKAGSAKLAAESFSMTEPAQEAVRVLTGQILERGVDVRVTTDMPVVRGERLRLSQVYQNLISNAIKFMGRQTTPIIELGVRTDDGETVFFVRDNGSGIDPRDQESIFGLFDRVDHRPEGSGIGLAIAKRVIELHAGQIWVESQGIGHGACFCFTIGHSTVELASIGPDQRETSGSSAPSK